jgi:hypothetical protein
MLMLLFVSVKTRIQLHPLASDRSISGGLRQCIASEGLGALATGLGPTVVGYFLQGAFKFGGYEFAKTHLIDALGYETSSRNRHAVYLGSSAIAEVAGDIALCPFEALRIRLVSQPTFGDGLRDGFARIVREEGIRGLYSGLGPILLKQYAAPLAPSPFFYFAGSTLIVLGYHTQWRPLSYMSMLSRKLTSGSTSRPYLAPRSRESIWAQASSLVLPQRSSHNQQMPC